MKPERNFKGRRSRGFVIRVFAACAGLQPVPQRPFTTVPRTSAETHGLQIRASGD
jgi:hypothetical protein